jgi:hypothetical protein
VIVKVHGKKEIIEVIMERKESLKSSWIVAKQIIMQRNALILKRCLGHSR